MSISDHVALTISTDSVRVARAGFGTPLVLSYTGVISNRLELVEDLAGVVALGFATTSPEYLMCSAIWSQSPSPQYVAIGRCDLAPTLAYKWTPTAINSHEYILNVKGEGVTAEAVDFTSDATATVAEICTGMTNALNAVVGKNFTATDNTTDVTIVGTAAGDWFSIEQALIGDGKIEVTHADPGAATDLAAIKVYNDNWYCVLNAYNSDAHVKAIAAWVETQKKIYIAGISMSEAVTLADGGGDTIDDLQTSAYERTAAMYHPDPSEFADCAWAGAVLCYNPGATTWKFHTLSGISATSFTSTQRTNLTAKYGNGYEVVAGVNMAFEGTCADGDFIDTVRGLDWLDDDISTRVFATLAAASNAGKKIPFTDAGVAVIQADIEASLLYGIQRGVLSDSPAPVVTVPDVADVSAANKTIRNLPDIKFTATLAGAVHKVTITGVVSV